MNASCQLWLSLSLFLSAPLAGAQDTAGPPEAPEQIVSASQGDILSMRTNGLDAALRSPKDQALLVALKLLVNRATELPEEFGQPNQIPPAAIPLIERLLYGQIDLRVGASAPGSESGLPFYARLELDQQEGFAPFAELLTNLLEQIGMELGEPDMEGRTALPLPVPAWFKDTGGNFELEVGDVSPRADTSSALELPDGTRETGAMGFNYGAFLNLLLPLMDTDQEREQMQQMMDLTGMGEMEIEYLAGVDEERAYARYIMRDWMQQETSEIMSTSPIPTAALNRIPMDAEWASLTCLDFSGALAFYGGLLEGLLDPEDEIPNLFEEAFGIHDFEVERDLTRYMGTVQGWYASPSGGGGLYSSIAFLSLTNEAAFAASLARLEEHFTDAVNDVARGYVRVHVTEEDGARLTTMQFPGLPIPLSLSYAIADGYWVLGLSRASVLASLAHAKSGASGLVDAPGFLEQIGGDPAGATAISYFNTPGLLADGYAIADMGATMLANTVRSRTGTEGATREVGQILPPLAELRAGALPMVSIGWIDGDDLITEYRYDRSALVNGTAMVPYIAGIYSLFFAAGALAGMEQSSSSYTTKQYYAQQEVRAIRAALERYASEHDGKYPKTIRALVRRSESGKQYLVRKDLPMDPWYRFYHYDPPTAFKPKPRVYSLGADGKLGGTKENRDIGSDTDLDKKSSPLERLIELFD